MKPACRQAGWYTLIDNMYYFYAIKSEKDSSIYKGISRYPLKRLAQHNSGNNKSTKSKIPYVMIYQEGCSDRIGARKLEKYYKSGIGREKLKKLIS